MDNKKLRNWKIAAALVQDFSRFCSKTARSFPIVVQRNVSFRFGSLKRNDYKQFDWKVVELKVR